MSEKQPESLTALCASTMAEVMQTRVGCDSDFFNMGGTSLQAMHWVMAIAAQSGLMVEVTDIYANPTPARLAAALGSDHDRALPTAEPQQTVFEICEHQRLRLAAARGSAREGRKLPNSQPKILAARITLHGRLDLDALASVTTDLGRRHRLLTSRFEDHDGDWVLRMGEAESSLKTVQGTADLDAELLEPFDLLEGPLMRVLVAPEAPHTWVVGLAVEHIAADGFSLNLLLEEMAQHYSALVGGRDDAPEGELVTGEMWGAYERLRAESAAGWGSRETYEQVVGGRPWRGLPVAENAGATPVEVGVEVPRHAGEPDSGAARDLLPTVIGRCVATLGEMLERPDHVAYLVVNNRSFATARTVGPLASVVPFRLTTDTEHGLDPATIADGVHRAVGGSAYSFFRYAREAGVDVEHQQAALAVVNILPRAAAETLDFGPLTVQRIESRDLSSRSPGVEISAEYDSQGICVTTTVVGGVVAPDVVEAGIRRLALLVEPPATP